jgi:hypothetical protein
MLRGVGPPARGSQVLEVHRATPPVYGFGQCSSTGATNRNDQVTENCQISTCMLFVYGEVLELQSEWSTFNGVLYRSGRRYLRACEPFVREPDLQLSQWPSYHGLLCLVTSALQTDTSESMATPVATHFRSLRFVKLLVGLFTPVTPIAKNPELTKSGPVIGRCHRQHVHASYKHPTAHNDIALQQIQSPSTVCFRAA